MNEWLETPWGKRSHYWVERFCLGCSHMHMKAACGFVEIEYNVGPVGKKPRCKHCERALKRREQDA